MSVLNNSLLLGAPAGGGGGGYQIERSLRFNSADSAYLNRTPASAGNRKTWTWSGWVKRSSLSTGSRHILVATPDGYTALYTRFIFTSNNIYISHQGGTSFAWQSSSLHRDPSAWFHVVMAVDTPQATSSNRLKIYVNGTQITASSATYPSINQDLYVNAVNAHEIGGGVGGEYFDGYLADVYLIDGQALEPTSFGEFDANNVWQPKAYTGSYGTNGFHLDFADNSTAAALGYDAAGSNDWTVNNLSVTAGAGNDSLVDTPTNYGTDTGAGGEVRSNYAVLNPIWASPNAVLSNGALEILSSNGNYQLAGSTIALTEKTYWETIIPSSLSFYLPGIVRSDSAPLNSGSARIGVSATQYPNSATIWPDGQAVYYDGNSVYSTGSIWSPGDVIGHAFDPATGQYYGWRNGTALNSGNPVATLSTSFTYLVAMMTASTTNAAIVNFGQRPFAYTAPSGFKALCTANLPAPTVANGGSAMDVVTYTGTGSTLSPTTTLGFNPDLIWIKSRSAATDHAIYDSVRGVQIRLESNTTDAEVATDNGVTAFNSAGFTLGTLAQVNTNAATYAAWCWDAGTSTATNNTGSISAQVRANASAGISVVTYTGNQTAGATVGHGLGVAPGLLIVKNRDTATFGWATWFAGFSSTEYVELNSTAAVNTNSTIWSGTLPTSSVFSVGASTRTNATGEKFVAYCFAPVAGFSAFGRYTGNGVSDGPFVYTGFRPRFVLIKMTTASNSWLLFDARRPGYNVIGGTLYPDSTSSEATGGQIDFVANGFKLRDWGGGENNSGATHYYAAFAESPFQSARAR